LDSLRSSDGRAPSAGTTRPPRFASRGHRGGVIDVHRALGRFVLGPLDLVTNALMVVLFTFGWIASLPWVCRFWQYAFQFGMRMLAMHTELGITLHQITPYVRFAIPFPRVDGVLPDAQTWWATAAVVAVLFTVSFFLSKRFIPIVYLLRAVLFLQVTALLFFLFLPARFSHSPDSYIEGLVGYAAALIGFVPVLLGSIYYIFDFGLVRKAFLTAMIMVHLSLFVPLQVLLQALILQKSVLFMPLLYIVFGLPLNVLVILAFYSWGMSWSLKGQREK